MSRRSRPATTARWPISCGPSTPTGTSSPQRSDFYARAFGAEEKLRMPGPGGRVTHAEMVVGDSMFMLADENPEMNARGPKAVGGTPVTLMLYVEDVDQVFARAVECGATVQRPLANQFYGDRTGGVIDPWGHVWYLATHVEDVSEEEMQRRMTDLKPQ